MYKYDLFVVYFFMPMHVCINFSLPEQRRTYICPSMSPYYLSIVSQYVTIPVHVSQYVTIIICPLHPSMSLYLSTVSQYVTISVHCIPVCHYICPLCPSMSLYLSIVSQYVTVAVHVSQYVTTCVYLSIISRC